MHHTLYIHHKVEKNLEQMKAMDNAPKFAAKRAETIIGALRNGATMARAGRLSKNKDARIRRLFKYDLGKGFRLISLKEKSELYILFVGSHDRCDTWLEKYRKKKPHQTEVPMTAYVISKKQPSEKQFEKACIPEPDRDLCGMLPDISQKELRRVFSGLVKSVQA
ncbi:MAG: hypothetical protein R6V54_10860 [Desulfobacteraceae bacterium]